MVWVPDAVSPVSLLPAVNVTTTLSPTFAVLPEVGETEVTVNVGAVVSEPSERSELSFETKASLTSP